MLTPADYDRWETLGATELSPDGHWLAWTVTRGDGDGELRVRRVGDERTLSVPHASRPLFSPDSRRLAYAAGSSRAERQALEAAGEPVRGAVVILDPATGDSALIPNTAAYEFSASGRFIAIRGYAGGGAGVPVTVRDLETGRDTTLLRVGAYTWSDTGALLAFTTERDDGEPARIGVYDAGARTVRLFASDTLGFTGPVWRPASTDLAALRSRGDGGHDLLVWRNAATRRAVQVLAGGARFGLPADWQIASQRTLRWSADGTRIFFGARPVGDTVSDTTDDRPTVQVWHSRDIEIVPELQARAGIAAVRTWLAAWQPGAPAAVLLGEPGLDDVQLSDGRFASAADPRPYAHERMFGPRYSDLYIIDTHTGARTRIAQRVPFHAGISPGGRYVAWVRDGDWWSYDVRDRRQRNLTRGLATSFINREHDLPTPEHPPYGAGGWTTGDAGILLHDRYDLWHVRLDGSGGTNLTRGAADRIRHRRVWLSPDQRVVDPAEPIYVTLFDERLKRHGYGRVVPGGGAERLVLRDAYASRLTRAADADVFMYRIETFEAPPEAFVGGPLLRDAQQVSWTNRFRDEYAWGRSEVIDFVMPDGTVRQAALFHPAIREPGRTHPLIVHPYELAAGTAHQFVTPSETEADNTTVFTQNGYFVLRPDIVFRVRDPGVSAVETIRAALAAVLARGDVDPARIGITGHSWGGYITAFAMTQTDLFRAGVAGAPLTNLFSMYLNLFWNTGDTNARMFELDQGRMQVPFWEDPDAYARNSPVFHIERLAAPLLVAFGDRDGAVDWRQGVELYNAARRTGRELVLLVYEGENHSLARQSNQRDYHRRALQWFGHYLKDEPAAAWMTGDPMTPAAQSAPAARTTGN